MEGSWKSDKTAIASTDMLPRKGAHRAEMSLV